MLDTINTGADTPSTTAAPEGYDAAMIKKFEESQKLAENPVPEPVAKDRPSWLPEKFASPEDMAESYAELEAKLAKGETKPTTAAEIDPGVASTASVEDARGALDSVGLDYDAISARYQEAGSLAEADRAALNKAGVPDAMIEAYVAGQQAVAQAGLNDVYASVGGEAKYAEMIGWASKALTPAEIAAFNESTSSKNLDTVKLAVAGLRQRHEAAEGREPSLVKASTGSITGTTFRSNAELVTAMSDPRYKTDAAYRNDVIQRLNRSSIF